MRRLVTALCLATLCLAGSHVGPAAAEVGATVVSVDDPAGDVVVNADYNVLTSQQARSIDLLAVDAVSQTRKVRFEVELDSILTRTGTQAEQVVSIALAPTRAKQSWRATVELSPQHPREGLASYYPGRRTTGPKQPRICDGLKVTAGADAVVTVRVPRRCLPRQPAEVTLQSRTGTFGDTATPTYSTDALTLRGATRLD